MVRKADLVIISDAANRTREEKVLDMIGQIEKAFNTGPIIGEAKEVIYHLAENIFIRDLILEAMGKDVSTREKMFLEAMEVTELMDKKVLKEREYNVRKS